MFRWLAGAAILASVALVSGAQAETVGRPFTKLSAERWSWAYRSVERLETAGYFTGCPAGTFNGTRPLTRYEFAAAVERIYRDLQTRVQAATEAGSLPGELFAVNQLLVEFGPDISDLGYDPAEMRRQLRAMSQRLAGLLDTSLEQSVPKVGGSSDLANRRFGSGGTFGLRRAMDKSGSPVGETAPDLTRPPSGPLILPGLTSSLGPVNLGFQVSGPDSLDTIPGLQFEDPAAGLRYRAQLSLPLGQYLLSAFYNKDNGRSDRFGLWDPMFSRPYQGIGGALSGSLSSRLDFDLETANLRADLDRMVYFRGGLNYELGRGFGLGFDVWKSYGSTMGGADLRGTGYVLSMKRSLGRNAQFNFLYRHFLADPGIGMGAAGQTSESGALGQVTVRF